MARTTATVSTSRGTVDVWTEHGRSSIVIESADGAPLALTPAEADELAIILAVARLRVLVDARADLEGGD